jgi:hypothetical protein
MKVTQNQYLAEFRRIRFGKLSRKPAIGLADFALASLASTREGTGPERSPRHRI